MRGEPDSLAQRAMAVTMMCVWPRGARAKPCGWEVGQPFLGEGWWYGSTAREGRVARAQKDSPAPLHAIGRGGATCARARIFPTLDEGWVPTVWKGGAALGVHGRATRVASGACARRASPRTALTQGWAQMGWGGGTGSDVRRVTHARRGMPPRHGPKEVKRRACAGDWDPSGYSRPAVSK